MWVLSVNITIVRYNFEAVFVKSVGFGDSTFIALKYASELLAV